MADFCYDCTPEPYKGSNDLVDLSCKPTEMFFAICEGCGRGWFNRLGKRVDPQAPAYQQASPERNA